MSRDQQHPQPAVRALVKLWTRWFAAVRNGACGWSWNPGALGAWTGCHAGGSSAATAAFYASTTLYPPLLSPAMSLAAPPRTAHRPPEKSSRSSSDANEPFLFNVIFHSQGFFFCWGGSFPQNTTPVPLHYHHITTVRPDVGQISRDETSK